jgi:hypothetical protein
VVNFTVTYRVARLLLEEARLAALKMLLNIATILY